jgi:hypothetical protein
LLAVVAAVDEKEKTDEEPWYADSACTQHICFEKSQFDKLSPITPKKFGLADAGTVSGKTFVARQGGLISKVANVHGKKAGLKINAVLVPGLRKNLLSVPMLDRKGYQVVFGSGKCNVFNDQGNTVATGILESNNLYRMDWERKKD